MTRHISLSIRLILPFLLLLSLKIWGYQAQLQEGLTPAIAEALQDLPSKGVLKQGPDGYVYLKIPDRYVYKLFPLVKEPGFTLPGHIRHHTKVGAHISVMYKGEGAQISPIHELGRRYAFAPRRIRHVRSGAKEYIILDVQAPQLERIRQGYGLTPKLRNHEFHITLAEKRLN